MEKYKTFRDFSSSVGIVPILDSVVSAVPVFFPVVLFFIWVLGTGASYYAIFKTSGKKRFWQSLTAMSFATFILSLTVIIMNKLGASAIEYLNGYWVGFYILMTVGSWFILENYK